LTEPEDHQAHPEDAVEAARQARPRPRQGWIIIVSVILVLLVARCYRWCAMGR
jgi:t-SNARE complex subunit (syntaxin)